MVRLLTIISIATLCLCVAMQVLGAPMTLWSVDSGNDVLSASILEGLSIPPSPLMRNTFCSDLSLSDHRQVRRLPPLPRSLFHPPPVLVPE